MNLGQLYLIGQTGYIIIAICVLVLLLIIFFVTYVINKKTPPPKGCENLIDEAKCSTCSNKSCSYNKLKEDLEEARRELKND